MSETATKPLETRVTVLEVQYKRIESDIESEKETRARANSALQTNMDGLRDSQAKNAKVTWILIGGLIVINALLPFILPGLLKASLAH